MSESTPTHSVLKTVAQVAFPFFLPSLLVIAIEAPQSLRVWLAAQDAHRPYPPICLPNDSRTPSRFQKISVILSTYTRWWRLWMTSLVTAWLAATMIIGIYLQVVDASYTNEFYIVSLFPIFMFTVSRAINLATGVQTRFVQRGADGRPLVVLGRSQSINTALMLLPYIAGGIVAYRSIFFEDSLCSSIAYGAVLHFLVSTDISTVRSFRASAACTSAIVIAVVVLFRHSKWSCTSDVILPHWPIFILSLLWNVFPADFILLCYRIDYASSARPQPVQSDDNEDEDSDSSFLHLHDVLEPYQDEKADYSSAPRPHASPVMIPASFLITLADSDNTPLPSNATMAGLNFSKPHFCAALLAWTLSSVGILAFVVVKHCQHVSPDAYQCIQAVLALGAMPAALVAAVAVAVWKGEMEELWDYAEEWSWKN